MKIRFVLSKIPYLLKLPVVLSAEPDVLSQKKKYLFVISHMRSYSTLLCHILGSNPEICGYSEMHHSYQTWWDLFKLRYKVYLECHNKRKCTYILDKLLHNRLHISPSIINQNEIYVVIMMRNPKDTIQSIIKLMNEFPMKEIDNIEKVVKYYIQRLQGISDFVQFQSQKMQILFFESEQLISQPREVLAELSRWLNLEDPLNQEYQQFKNTGKRRQGDPSDLIKHGKIQRNKSINSSDNDIPLELLQVANQAYIKYKNICLTNDHVKTLELHQSVYSEDLAPGNLNI